MRQYGKIMGWKMEEEEKIRLSFGRQHIDLIYKVVAVDEESQTETIVIEADPHRYDWLEVNGNWLLVDKFEPDALTADNFFALVAHIFHTPVYHEIKDTTDAEIKRKYLRIYVTRKIGGNG